MREAESILRATEGAEDETSVRHRGLALWNLGEALCALGRLEEAADRLGQAGAALLPGQADRAAAAYGRQAQALLSLARYEEAGQVLDRLIALANSVPVARELLPNLLVERIIALEGSGRSDKAYAAASRLIDDRGSSSAPDDRSLVVRTLVLQATVARSLGRLDLAQAALAAAIERCDGDPALVDHLAEAMIKRGMLFEEVGLTDDAMLAYSGILNMSERAPDPRLDRAVAQAQRRLSALSL
jgi:tetratricopeptide (TPR) repeat protein